MARIYKFSGYALAANDEELDIESLIEQEDCDAFIRTNEYEEFEWDDDLEITNTDDYWVVDKMFCQLAYDRANEELKKHKKTWRKILGVCTPGGDPAYECPVCGKGSHIYGVESLEPHKRCRDCGTELFYPWEVE